MRNTINCYLSSFGQKLLLDSKIIHKRLLHYCFPPKFANQHSTKWCHFLFALKRVNFTPWGKIAPARWKHPKWLKFSVNVGKCWSNWINPVKCDFWNFFWWVDIFRDHRVIKRPKKSAWMVFQHQNFCGDVMLVTLQ